MLAELPFIRLEVVEPEYVVDSPKVLQQRVRETRLQQTIKVLLKRIAAEEESLTAAITSRHELCFVEIEAAQLP